MRNPLIINKQPYRQLLTIHKLNISNILTIKKETIVRWLFYFGILLAFFGSATPWFLWGIYRYYVLFAFVPIITSMLYGYNNHINLFSRKDFKLPTLFAFLALFVMALTSGKNVNGLVMVFFSTTIYFALFKYNKEELGKLSDMLTNTMMGLMAVSIPFYFLYLAGVSLPHHGLVVQDYTFENYIFFLVDDRFRLELIPRFHSVFLEPAHLGMACIALLYSQIGKWNTWRCKVLFFTVAITFSLAAYICMVALLFSSAWMKGKAVIGKIIMLISIGATIIIGSIFYNDGNNLVNMQIVQRLTMNNDGKIEGDNRTTGIFTKVYDKFTESDDFFFGAGMENMLKYGSGNAGYRVFFYTYGFLSFIFVIALFIALLYTSTNIRACISVIIINAMSFIPHGIPTKFYLFIPLYILLFSDVYPNKKLSHGSE